MSYNNQPWKSTTTNQQQQGPSSSTKNVATEAITTSSTDIPDGASSLMSMFQKPPPPTTGNNVVNNGDNDDNSATEQTSLLQQQNRLQKQQDNNNNIEGLKTPITRGSKRANTYKSLVGSSNSDSRTTTSMTTSEAENSLSSLFRNDNSTQEEEEAREYMQPVIMPTISEDDDDFKKELHSSEEGKEKKKNKFISIFNINSTVCKELANPTTYIGSVMFLLYHVVFCLAMGSALIRPSSSKPILGIMIKMSAVGIIFASPFMVYRLGRPDIPALYPSIDLFLAPFLASAIVKIDDILTQEQGHQEQAADGENNDDKIFFSTFIVLSGIGMTLSGLALLLASKFKLANLGLYLPYSVLCGFFSAVGVLLWALAFSVDTNGKKWQNVFFSGDINLIWDSLVHHLPSLFLGILMNRLGPKHPFIVVLLIIVSLCIFYSIMWLTGTSLEDAQNDEWFWKSGELIYDNDGPRVGFSSWLEPPAPFAIMKSLLDGTVHWGAVLHGLKDMFALAVLYLLRSSIHASALKKNIGNLVRKEPINNNNRTRTHSVGDTNNDDDNDNDDCFSETGSHYGGDDISSSFRVTTRITDSSSSESGRRQSFLGKLEKDLERRMSQTVRRLSQVKIPLNLLSSISFTQRAGNKTNKAHNIPNVSERLDIEATTRICNRKSGQDGNNRQLYREIRPKSTKRTLQDIFIEYGYSLLLVAVVGGFGNCPTVATSNTMYAIGAEHTAPQYGSTLLLVFFYLTDFRAVRYIPKMAFSSLLVLGAVDTFVVWFFQSFRKTKDILEWLVVPIIVAFSLVVGFLNAVFLGVAISTFVFVASFFRTGVVKFVATGLELRSTIERSKVSSDWLDTNGADKIQILVLQNYLFFGNANTILSYITTMFEEVEYEADDNNDNGAVTETPRRRQRRQRKNQPSFNLPPPPKFLVMEMSLITGMDTSTVDIFKDIKELCKNNGCKIFFCGLAPRLRKSLAFGGVKPEAGVRSKRSVRFFPSLDSALGKAEDMLVKEKFKDQISSQQEVGFQFALRQIDEQHGQDFVAGLRELEPYTQRIVLETGEHLFVNEGGQIEESERGLFFIESGILKIERDASGTLTMPRGNTMTRDRSFGTLNQLSWGAVGRQSAAIKSNALGLVSQNLRLARIGPGWVCGVIEGATGLRNPGIHTAVSRCVLHHLPYKKIEELETDHPVLILQLYKMLAHLMSIRQETTIAQLAALHSIMSSPAHQRPLSRKAIYAISKKVF